MAVAITNLPRGARHTIREVSRNRVMTPTFGGPETMIARIGTRSAMDVQVPAIASRGCGPALIAALLRGRTEGVVIDIPEPKVEVRDYGVPLVNGANQQGMSLIVDGLPAGAVIPIKWLSLIVNGRRFAYFITGEVTADGLGRATLPIWPMIRRSPPDNATVELAKPKMEGFVQDVVEREIQSIGAITVSFRIIERE